MKRFCCFTLCIALLFSMLSLVRAAEATTADFVSYIEATTGDTIKVEEISISKDETKQKDLSETTYATRIFRNGLEEEILYVDFKNGILRHELSDGSVVGETLSDIVIITSIGPSEDDSFIDSFISAGEENTRIDYIDDEPLSVSSSGTQAVLTGAQTYSGYRAMGYRGGYSFAPTTYGYLQRYNAGVDGTYYSHMFSFRAGTQIGTAASIVVAFFSESGIGGMILSIAISLLGAIIDVVTYDWSTVFEVKTYKWLYRLRLNSNTGAIIYSNYRTKDYWKSYNPATGEASYDYRGSAYDWGFLLSNTEMIKAGINSYLEALL